MDTITISKNEYEKLVRQAKAYREVTAHLFDSVLDDSVDAVVEDFRATGLYKDDFLQDLESGLKKSSYRKNHEDKTA